MKRVNIKCPYCGSQALLRPASVVYGGKAKDPAAPYYVCAHYPACDAYVAAHRRTRLPMGTLANADLRRRRIQAHAAFNRLWADEQAAGVSLAPGQAGSAGTGSPHREVLRIPL